MCKMHHVFDNKSTTALKKNIHQRKSIIFVVQVNTYTLHNNHWRKSSLKSLPAVIMAYTAPLAIALIDIKIFLDLIDQFRRLEDFIFLTMSLPTWNIYYMKPGRFQFYPYIKDGWDSSMWQSLSWSVFSQWSNDSMSLYLLSYFRLWHVSI